MAGLLMSKMKDRAAFEDHATLTDFLAKQLLQGRLSVALGAGVSFAFNLPSWDTLVQRAYDRIPAPRPPNLNNEECADALLSLCGSDDRRFATLVRDALYDGYDSSLDTLRSNSLLAALGALMMVSSRGSVSRVVTFNFDDILETYLRYFGMDVESISSLPRWQSRTDVRVFHPHGFLPRQDPLPENAKIVMAQLHYDRVVGNTSDLWHAAIADAFRSTTVLFLGLSGSDANLTSILTKTNDNHVAKIRGDAFWGVRFGVPDDARIGVWETRGVFHAEVPTYEAIPGRLIAVCQRAAELARASRT